MMRFSVLLVGLLLAEGVCSGQDRAELEADHNVRSEFATPHTAWAEPYVQGTTRVLFFINGRGTVPREVIELKQRFDLDPQMVFWTRVVDTTREEWHGGENGVRRMARLLTEKWGRLRLLRYIPGEGARRTTVHPHPGGRQRRRTDAGRHGRSARAEGQEPA